MRWKFTENTRLRWTTDTSVVKTGFELCFTSSGFYLCNDWFSGDRCDVSDPCAGAGCGDHGRCVHPTAAVNI